MKPLHQRLILYQDGKDAYTFAPADVPGGQLLTINRHSGEITLNRPGSRVPQRAVETGRSIFGILGLISLSSSDYLVIITGKDRIGRWMEHDIFRATDFDILPISGSVSIQNPPHLVEGHLLALLRWHLKESTLLYSYTWDLTRRLQVQWMAQESDEFKAMWQTADERFFWNRYLQSRFIEVTMRDEKQDLSPFILPVMYGTFGTRGVIVKDHRIELCLISRRSRHRAGTRYFRRGIDSEGHVANYNETEQIIVVPGPLSDAESNATGNGPVARLSYVQIRGSVPVFWAEVNTLRYKPDVQIMDLQETVDSMRKHFHDQESRYGTLRLVNLVNKQGHEKPVKEAYEQYLAQVNMPDLDYVYFDFHKECKNMRWDRISILIDDLNDGMQADGYFHLDASQPMPIRLQGGIIRTNCLDNLDRTNIVQSALAKRMLSQQLQALGFIGLNELVDDFDELSQVFRELWTEMGDSVARSYSGSGAMKADFTRNNKRTKAGEFEDGYKGALRYFKNNFFDGARQDAFDLFTGAWTPRYGSPTALSLLTDTRPLMTRSMPYIAWYSLFMICAGLTLPRTSDYSLFYYFVLWSMLMVLSILFIFAHGMDYVSWPKLVPLDDVIYYDGPGKRYGRYGKGIGIKVLSRGSGKDEMEMGTKKRID